MPFPYHLTAMVTLLTLALYFVLFFNVGRARVLYNVPAPSMDGPAEFLRAYRVQMNTAEQLILFLPLLWLTAALAGDKLAAGVGVFWPLGRIFYAYSYYRDPKTRAPGFALNMLVNLALFAACLVDLVL